MSGLYEVAAKGSKTSVPFKLMCRKAVTLVSGRPSLEIHETTGTGSPVAEQTIETPVSFVNSSNDGGSLINARFSPDTTPVEYNRFLLAHFKEKLTRKENQCYI